MTYYLRIFQVVTLGKHQFGSLSLTHHLTPTLPLLTDKTYQPTPSSSTLNSTSLIQIIIMEIDVQGARTIRSLAESYGLKPKYLFIAPPSIDMLKERLQLRGTEVTLLAYTD